jgi:hypothetical protein
MAARMSWPRYPLNCRWGMKAMVSMACGRESATFVLELALHLLIFLFADLAFGISRLQD